MIVEGAFLKIPEVLIGYENDPYLYEASVTNLFSNSLLLELNARNIDSPLGKIHFEKRYQADKNQRCDIYTDFNFVNPKLSEYGYYQKNWIEAKYFGNTGKKSGNETKSENAGSIAVDIYRLIKKTNFDKNMGLYCLVAFDDKPEKYLALTRQNGSDRIWAQKLLENGTHDFKFDITEEPKTIKELFLRKGLIGDLTEDITLDCKIRVTTFSPLESGSGFYGSLIQIFEV